jgi:hypothetical protein
VPAGITPETMAERTSLIRSLSQSGMEPSPI